jgi:hypothetical protein
MLRLPDDSFVTIELVHDPAGPSRPRYRDQSHLAVQVGSLDATLASLAAQGITAEPPELPADRTDRRHNGTVVALMRDLGWPHAGTAVR